MVTSWPCREVWERYARLDAIRVLEDMLAERKELRAQGYEEATYGVWINLASGDVSISDFARRFLIQF